MYCGFTVTNERPQYKDLNAKEKEVVDIVIEELTGLNDAIVRRTSHNINEVLDKEHISVSFEGMIFSGNLGDNIIHVATWDNLSDAQRSLIQTWFSTTADLTAHSYKKFFYRFLTVSQGVKQFMYNVLTPAWVFGNRSLFTVERDSIRTALAYYSSGSQTAEMWDFLRTSCKSVINQYNSTYSALFTKEYLKTHFTELADPKAPTGYMYFICRWIDLGMSEAQNLSEELIFLQGLASQ